MGKNMTTLLLILGLSLVAGSSHDFPPNEYEYSLRRDDLKGAEKSIEGHRDVLSPDEEIVDHYLQYLKWEEFISTKDTGFPPMRPIEEMMGHIVNSSVFRVLRSLPKGGNMHTHEIHQVSRRIVVDILFESEDFEYLYILPEPHPNAWQLDFFVNPPESDPSWVNVKDDGSYTREMIAEKLTFTDILDDNAEARRYPSDTGLRWAAMNPLWSRGGPNIMSNYYVKVRYLEELLQTSLDEGVQYLETRKNLSPAEALFVMDPSGEYNDTNGKRYLDNSNGELEIETTLEVVRNFTEKNPLFIGHKRIVYTIRVFSMEDVLESMQHVEALREKYPDHILGADLVGEEDAGNSLLVYLENFLKFQDDEGGRSRIPFYLHTAETNWPDDLISSKNPADLVGTSQNTYEAILLGSKRVGHGLGFSRHPYLLKEIRERDIAVEVCPVSNQILGYYPDLRVHPAHMYHRAGIPIIFGSDDAGSFGVDHFTLDWYEAFTAWGLDLADLKQIANNSLQYSGMSESEKQDAFQKWTTSWDAYITSIKTEACDLILDTSEPAFARILPREGTLLGGTLVHIFGRHFERGICEEVQCRFGTVLSTNAKYISTNHLICRAPDQEEFNKNLWNVGIHNSATNDYVTVPVDVSFDGGVEYYSTGENFTYRYEPKSDITTVEPPPSSNSPMILGLHHFLIAVVLFSAKTLQ